MKADFGPLPTEPPGLGLTACEALALKALRAAEWGGEPFGGVCTCPVCDTTGDDPHFGGCLLKQALDALECRS